MSRCRMRWLWLGVAVMMLGRLQAGEIQYVEDFALAEDRSVPLAKLVPGTDDYYYYHCLHLQNQGRFQEVEGVLNKWIAHHNGSRTQRAWEITHRQMLLQYPAKSQAVRSHLVRHLGLHFNHQREQERKITHPSRLSPRQIDRSAFRRHWGSTSYMEDRAMEWLVRENMSAGVRREVLHRLKRPDYPNLPRLVVDDLNYKHSGGFGSHPVHRMLLQTQLDAVRKLKPDLAGHEQFVFTYLVRLQPAPDEDWRYQANAREAYLNRLWAFVSTLPPNQNSLKAHVLYHRLVHDRAQGVFDAERFLTYLKLPRQVHYIEPHYITRNNLHRVRADLNRNYQTQTLFPPVRNDEPLVRDLLLSRFADANDTREYEPYIYKNWLQPVFAEAKIVNGKGDVEQWASIVGPGNYKRIRERVDIDFAHTNPAWFGAADEVKLDLFVKNCQTLLVKVFRVNAENYYRTVGREVATDINLDGLVANQEFTKTYTDSPFLRVKRSFPFPQLKAPGVYVLEFIGGGESSRAVIRKGRLRFVERTTLAGHEFTVLDETNALVKGASIWLAGHEYTADKKDVITIPYTEKPGAQALILKHAGLATLERFQHQRETYRLQAGIHVDREELIQKGKANILIRPALRVNGLPCPIGLLEEVTLTIASTDAEGTPSSQVVRNIKLHRDQETVHPLSVPKNMRALAITLSGKVQPASRDSKDTLSANHYVSLNQIDATDKVEDLHLARTDKGYVLYLLGKSGEIRPQRTVRVTVKHRDFRRTMNNIPLQTDARGRIELTQLAEIQWIQATGPENTSHRWVLQQDEHTLPATIHGRAGTPIRVPWMGTATAGKPSPEDVSLLELRGGQFYKDCFNVLSVRNGFLEIQDLGEGSYSLWLKDPNRLIQVQLVEGRPDAGYILGKKRHLEIRNAMPLQVERVWVDEDTLKAQLRHANKTTRVHMFSTRFVPEHEAYARLSQVTYPEPFGATLARSDTHYLLDRAIGDEYRYILERRMARKFPGNMLARPELLLNPWVVQETSQDEHRGKGGGRYASRRGGGSRSGGRHHAKNGKDGHGAAQGFANLDFLPQGSVVLANLVPDEAGLVNVPLKDLGPRHLIQIVAVDHANTVSRVFELPETEVTPQNLRLKKVLAPDKHFAEHKKITLLTADQTHTIADAVSADAEMMDTLAKVFQLYTTLTHNATLAEFSFILRWPEMKRDEKTELYAKYACHELNLFLQRKDKAFFESTVLPSIQHKKDKTFMDYYLLRGELAGYRAPWQYDRLNLTEKVLLAERMKQEHAFTAQRIREAYEVIPPDLDRFNHLFRTVLQRGTLASAPAGAAGEDLGAALDVMEEKAAETFGRQSRDKSFRARGAPPPAAKASAPATPKPGVLYAKKAKREDMRKLKQDARDAPAEIAAEDMDDALQELVEKEMDAEEALKESRSRRERVRRFYRKLEKTKEWAENNYYKRRIHEQIGSLIPTNGFWRDFAARDPGKPFTSTHLAEPTSSFAEMMLALSVLDLPFANKAHKVTSGKDGVSIQAGSPIVLFHKEVQLAGKEVPSPVLVSQNFFRHGDRHQMVQGERVDKFVTEEFQVHTVYGCQVVLTNPSSATQKVDVLMQVPEGALPVMNGFYTRSHYIRLEPHGTRRFEFYFYFPDAGKALHFPVHVAKSNQLVAYEKAFVFNVVERLTKVDKASWAWISQNGTPEQVLEYLQSKNLQEKDLGKIAWRMRDKGFFSKAVTMLADRHYYHPVLWSYGVHHDDLPVMNEYLKHRDDFLKQVGDTIACQLIHVDPVERMTYEHLEYKPLVNPRRHRFGAKRKILNQRFYAQYHRLMKILTYRSRLSEVDELAVTTYLLLQDRVEDALTHFKKIDRGKVQAKMQYDYLQAYLAFYEEKPREAYAIAKKYADYPHARWRKLFGAVATQVKEIQGATAAVADDKDRTQQQTQLSATEPGFSFKVESRKVQLEYQNLETVTVNYYRMDLELLFSRNPFVGQQGDQFALIQPNRTDLVKLSARRTAHEFAIPKEFHASNVMVEILGAGIRKSRAYFANTMSVQLIENYGQVKVADKASKKPLGKVYVKAYARTRSRDVVFYKDGYTDLRGRFDYASLNSDLIDQVDRFALLIMSDTHGAMIMEAAPPKR